METVTKSHADRLWAGIRVRDQGLGMSVTEMARAFEKFYRAKPTGAIPGTGLGMSLVKEITELQDGHVQLVSESGQGTEITLWFPARMEEGVS
jgi:signal transduction histidine kinase